MGASIDQLTKYFAYLNELRVSGETNMWGAGPYLEAQFDIDRDAAKQALVAWMDSFSDASAASRATLVAKGG